MQLVLYGHDECCLCDRLAELIGPHVDALRKRGEVTLIKRDIADDPAWTEAYRYRIPVLMAGDEVILEGRPEETEVAQAFEQLAAQA